MANVFAIHSVCQSVMGLLQDSYPASLAELPMPACRFEVLSSGQIAAAPDEGNRVGLWLYRTTTDPGWRLQATPGSRTAAPPALALELHFLLAVWSARAQDEQVLLAWVQRQLHQRPMLDVASLTAEAGWGADETIQLVPANLALDETLKIWSALGVPYRLCLPYTARVLRLEADALPEGPPVQQTPLVQPLPR